MELFSHTDTRTVADIEREARSLRAKAVSDLVSGFFARLFHTKPAAKPGKAIHTPA